MMQFINLRFLKKILLIITVGLLAGCSTQKNTLLNRSYHNLTAKFNYLFNAQESYSNSTTKLAKEYAYDYNSLLPVFLFSDKATPSKTAEGMDRAILKSGFLIKYHSITAKPKFSKNMSQKEQAFYNKREFCNYVDDAYMLIAKGNVYQQEYEKARQAFDQVLLNYDDPELKAEALIWQGAIAGAEGDLVQYEDALSTLELRKCPPSKLSFLRAAQADYYIKKKEYGKAAEYMQQAAAMEKDKLSRDRYMFILGQLYNLSGNKGMAQRTFKTVAQKASSYEMSFNAKLEEARSYTTGNPNELKNVLMKMAKSERNAPYRDQIYYTIGSIFLADKNESEALIYFNKSLEYSSPNSNQKGVTFFTLANIAYNKKQFIKAQSLYDSVTAALPTSHRLSIEASSLSKKLERLSHNLQEYNRLDSLIRLSQLSNDELNKIIDNQIVLVKAKQAKAAEDQNRQQQFLMRQDPLSLSSRQSSGWYFYNQSTLAFGATEFKMRWGNRKLEDNWRRKNKSSVGEIAEEKKEENKETTNKFSPLSREYYMVDIPKSNAERQNVQTKANQALLEVAEAYRSDIKAPEEAISTAELLLNKNLTSEQEERALTICYLSYMAISDITKAQYYQDVIKKKYPASSFTEVSMPKGAKEASVKVSSKALDESTKLLNSGNYKAAVELVNISIKTAPAGAMPQLALIRAMAVGGLEGRDAYRKELALVASQYPNSEAANTANEYLQILDKGVLSSVSTSGVKKEVDKPAVDAEVTTKYLTADGDHTMIIIVPKSVNVNQLKFNLVSFNLEAAPNTELSITNQHFDSNNEIVVIKAFANKQLSMDYYYQLLQRQDIISQAGAQNFVLFSISVQNLDLLMKDKSLKTYSDFFMLEYLN